MQAAFEFLYSFNHSQPITVSIVGHDPRKMNMAKLKSLLLLKETDADSTLTTSTFEWEMRVNGKLLNVIDASNKKVAAFLDAPPPQTPMQVSLSLKESARHAKQKRAREHVAENDVKSAQLVQELKRAKTPELRYDLTVQLLRIARERVLLSDDAGERTTNGLLVEQVYNLLGHVRAKVGKLVSQDIVFFVQTEASEEPSARLNADVALWPMFIPGHVSLKCQLQTKQLLNLDSSGSIPRVLKDSGFASKTHVNYQYFDKTRNVGGVEMAGGNCSLFTAVNAIRWLLNYRHYSTMDTSFNVFWKLFKSVATKSAAIPMEFLVQVATRLTGGPPPGEFATSPALLMHAIFLMVKMTPKLASANYSADIIFLQLFHDTQIGGFEGVVVLGHVLRRYLREELVERVSLMSRISDTVVESDPQNAVARRGKYLYGMSIRIHTAPIDSDLVFIENTNTKQVCVAKRDTFLSQPQRSRNSVEFSGILATAVGLKGPFQFTPLDSTVLPIAARVVFREEKTASKTAQLELELLYFQMSLESVVQHLPAIAIGQKITLALGKRVQVMEIFSENTVHHKVARIPADINVLRMEIEYACLRDQCFAVAASVCGGCGNAAYCSRKCQAESAGSHKCSNC